MHAIFNDCFIITYTLKLIVNGGLYNSLSFIANYSIQKLPCMSNYKADKI